MSSLRLTLFFAFLILFSCDKTQNDEVKNNTIPGSPYVIVLGIAQDAGFPQADCKKDCCAKVWKDDSLRKKVSCIGIVDPETGSTWMIDATPDFKEQLQHLTSHNSLASVFSGIFLTHAHMGHYTGLIHLGREAMGSKAIPVYAMPRMKEYLTNNGPWSQLVSLDNIKLLPLNQDKPQVLNERLKITPLLVPHRDEFSETVGFSIEGPGKKLLFIPDIDKWSKWDRALVDQIEKYDYLLLDGSFYANGEIPNRDMSEIPHPFVKETMQYLDTLSLNQKEKVHFIHLNHTNPLLDTASAEYKEFRPGGYHVCKEFQIFSL